MLYRRTRVVRDHEWRRSRAVKSVSGHFKAEDSGVWEKEIVMDTQLSAEGEANLKGQVSGAVGVISTPGNAEVETEVQVEMLVDAEHVRRAQARVSGDEQFDEGGINSTIGAVRKPSPMDSFLDWIASLRGRNRKLERDAKKNAALTARSTDAPVIAQRPIAPIQRIESEEKRPVPMEMVSVTDTGAESVIIDEETGKIEKVVAAHDVGKAINPLLCEGQIEGAVHMGLGYALSEGFHCDEVGQPNNLTLKSLSIIRPKDMPDVEVILVESPQPNSPYGIKGVGEIGLVPTAGAVAAALNDLDGMWRNELPMEDESNRERAEAWT